MYGNNGSDLGNSSSGFGKKNSEDEMTSVALNEAIDWTRQLMDMEFRGRGDRDYMIRGRISDESGVPESYLYRLQHKARDMKDVGGEYYRRLKLYYERKCQNNEDAAERSKTKRLELKARHETTDKKRTEAALGSDPAVD